MVGVWFTVVEIDTKDAQRNSFGVDAFKVAKEAGKHRVLGSQSILSYQDIFDRVKNNLDKISLIQKKKELNQQAYESKETKMSEI